MLCLFVCCAVSAEEGWSCPVCGEKTEGIFCKIDGTQKPGAGKIKAGDIVGFGSYPQMESGNDNTVIEWLVLEVQNDRALLISKYGLDAKPYNTKNKGVTWETCTLRNWLNTEFMNKAFSPSEQQAILKTAVDNSKKQGDSNWKTTGGNNTQDFIYLLSIAEAKKYFGAESYIEKGSGKNTASRVQPTKYAIAQGAWAYGDSLAAKGAANGFWWLRSPSSIQSGAAGVDTFGDLFFSNVNNKRAVVRPVLWLDLTAGLL